MRVFLARAYTVEQIFTGQAFVLGFVGCFREEPRLSAFTFDLCCVYSAMLWRIPPIDVSRTMPCDAQVVAVCIGLKRGRGEGDKHQTLKVDPQRRACYSNDVFWLTPCRDTNTRAIIFRERSSRQPSGDLLDDESYQQKLKNRVEQQSG